MSDQIPERKRKQSPDLAPTPKRPRYEADPYSQSLCVARYGQPPLHTPSFISQPVLYSPPSAPCSSQTLNHSTPPRSSVFERLGPQAKYPSPPCNGPRGQSIIPNHSNTKKGEGKSLGAHPNPTKRKRDEVFALPLKDDICLHEIANSEQRSLAGLLTRRQQELNELLSSKSATAGRTTLTLLVKIFAKMCDLLRAETSPSESKSQFASSSKVCLPDKEKTKIHHIMKYLIDEDTIGGFYLSLSNYLCQMPVEGSVSKRKDLCQVLSDTIKMLNVLLDIYPGDSSKNLSVIDTCVCTTAQLAQQQTIFQRVSEEANRLLQIRNGIRAQSYERNCEKPNFQAFSVILPRPDQLHEVNASLQKNIVSGPFPDVTNYLSTQFHLLREDFLRPLRNALTEICHIEDDEEEESVMIYTNVCFNRGMSYTLSGNAYRVSFKTKQKINWNRSKKLQYGALVCLSRDGFKTVYYATIVERDVEDLSQGITTIQLQECSPSDEMSISTYEFSMIESPGYYVAYAPVLKRLDAISPPELPFEKYLVGLDTQVNVPSYIKDIEHNIDLKGIVCKCEELHEWCEHEYVEIFDQEEWDALETPLLDSSQKEALHVALTKEVAIIQGPPGTGKTYVGLKIMEALLRNASLWQCTLSRTGNSVKCPIVVICYTNHALDQFLEGILRLNSRIQIRRIGRRTQSEVISKLNLQQFVRKYCREHRIFNPMKSFLEKQRLIEAMKEFMRGQFNQENSQLYCYCLSSYVLDDIQNALKIESLIGEETCEEFACWLDPVLRSKIARFHQNKREKYYETVFGPGAEEDERREMSNSYSDHPEIHDILQAVGHDGIRCFIEKFGKVEALTETRARTIIDRQEETDGYVRLQLFKYCLNHLYQHESADLRYHAKKQAKYDEDQQLIKLRCLQKADVIGLTTTAAARDNLLISQLQSKILIVEEAAEVLEPQLVASLTKHTQHLILIGDHKQLRPKTIDHLFGREYKLEISMFERLVMNNFPHATLKVQHRMRPEISALVSRHIYSGILRDDESTLNYPVVQGMKLNMFFIDHSQPEQPNSDIKSPSNEHEATFLAALCKYILQQGYSPHQITVITPYVGQMFMLREIFREKLISEVRITPIDGYQGEENEIILLSLVRSKRPGFVKDENRICVALSRAKHGLYCIGNFTTFKRCKLWSDILKDVYSKGCLGDRLPLQCVRHNNVTTVSCAADFEQVSHGGCYENCNRRLRCNHVCTSKCHPSDEVHELPCELPCPKRCPDGHRCKRLCHEKCGSCKELVDKIIEKCQHKQLVPCSVDPKAFVCQMECPKPLNCGHKCKEKCGEICTTECNIFVEKELSCGHTAKVECHVDEEEGSRKCKHPCGETLKCEHECAGTCGNCRQGRLHAPCKEKCSRVLICGHPCKSNCARNCPSCSEECKYACKHAPCGHKCSLPCCPCPHECDWKCKHFQCTRMCGEMCDRPRCDEKCLKPLSCGHPCIGVCGEPCPSICRQCLSHEDFETQIPLLFGNEYDEDAQFVVLEDCGHVMEVTALDHWIDQNEEQDQEIKWKCCPQCTTPVMKTARYSNVTKGIILDMNEIKKKKLNLLSANERNEMKKHLTNINFPLEALQKEGLIGRQIQNRQKWNDVVQGFNHFWLHKAYTIYVSAGSVLQARKTIQSLLIQRTYQCTTKGLNQLLSQANDFLNWLKVHKQREILTDQMIIDINAERRRILLLEVEFKTLITFIAEKVQVKEEDMTLLQEIKSYATNGSKIPKITEESMYERMLKGLQNMPKKYRVPLTIDERRMIIKAIGAKTGSWYKCPNGHYYQIGECGGAMQTSKCPECGETIGGRNHQLLGSNQHAREFDQSSHAAWSEGANLQNFDLDDL